MNEQTEIPLQQSGNRANVSQQLVLPAADSKGATLASETAHQLPTSSRSINNLWQCQSFVDNVRSQLIDSWQRPMETNKVKSEPFASHSTNQIKQDKSSAIFKLVVASVLNNVLVDLWQCQMEIKSTNNLVGFCYNNKSEQVTCRNCASAQLVGSCHDRKQRELGTVFPLNLWALATIKSQSQL
jgi:hypothetical protein